MQIIEEKNEGQNQIRGYSPGQIKVNDTVYSANLIMTSDLILENWPVTNLADLQTEHLEKIIEIKPDLVIFGSGKDIIFPNQQLLLPLQQLGIGTETMNTAAACRTYNIILGEGRKVAIALIL